MRPEPNYLFVGEAAGVEHSPGLEEPKAVLTADVYAPPAHTGGTAYLSVIGTPR